MKVQMADFNKDIAGFDVKLIIACNLLPPVIIWFL